MRKLKNEELNRISVSEFKKTKKVPLIIVLDNIRSLNNIGSVFRTADAFLIKKIVLCGITATPPHRDIQKTAIGATETVDWEYSKTTSEAIHKLKNNGVVIIGVEQTQGSTMLNNMIVSTKKAHALVFGNEINGISQEIINHCDKVVEIPQKGTKHSLNVAVSVGVVLWHFFSKQI